MKSKLTHSDVNRDASNGLTRRPVLLVLVLAVAAVVAVELACTTLVVAPAEIVPEMLTEVGASVVLGRTIP